MRFYSARQAIHEAYFIHLKSKGFEVKLTDALREPDFSGYLRKAHRKHHDDEARDEKRRAEMLGQFQPVGFYQEDRSVKLDANRLISDGAEAGKIIAVVEKLPAHLKSWCYWCYSPLGQLENSSNQSLLDFTDDRQKVVALRNEQERLEELAYTLEARIKRCKNIKRLNELLELDEDQLRLKAERLEQQADRIENALRLGDRFSAELWRWLDELVEDAIDEKVRPKTRRHIKDVVIASVYNYRVRVYGHGLKPFLSRRDMCEKFGVPAENFERDYRWWMNWTTDVCNELDREALVPVATIVLAA
ncbi:hypothetical protein GZ77_20575 [Endozoicomonas montiporae]|uniref:Uncharacterized protein n=2 Tax=Endozoicomonas montiporae TaxID=1027273 RepID=A0A081N319_9GAMM|nr:hypothetical protein [Endozoicomonas montiporae]AMO58132.1 hypothetical protein EZMO1_4209 [Endozoicomonas montiporae CL-33]KEQ12842.1 hypothetical protein GZ77_20575 [Endozoicomonas montiporae]